MLHRLARLSTRRLRLAAVPLVLVGGGAVAAIATAADEPTGPAIATVGLWFADDDRPLVPDFWDGLNLDLTWLSRNLTFVAATSPEKPGSVVFTLDGDKVSVENVAPYSIAGDDNGNLRPWTPRPGSHVLTVQAFAGPNGTGAAGVPRHHVFTSTDPTKPLAQDTWSAAPITLPGTIEAENYDRGGPSVAYYDADAANLGNVYRQSEGVDLRLVAGASAAAVTNTRVKEWTEYTVDIPSAGSYDLALRYAAGSSGGTVRLSLDGTDLAAPVTLAKTGGWSTWKNAVAPAVKLPAGRHVLRLTIDSAPGGEAANIDAITATKVVVPPTPSPVSWPSSFLFGRTANEPRFEAAYANVGGKLWAIGGFADADFKVHRSYVSYDPVKNAWATGGTLPVGVAETHAGVAHDDRYVYYVGGFAGDLQLDQTPTQKVSSRVMRFDTQTNTWTQPGWLPEPRGGGGAALVGTKLYYFGGNPADRETNLGDNFIFDLVSKKWTKGAPMPEPKDHFSVAVYEGQIYAIGGEIGHDKLHDQRTSVHAYDPVKNVWTTKASMPEFKSHTEGGTFVRGGRIYVAGGQIENFKSTASVLSYDPVTDKWSSVEPPLPLPRQGAAIQPIGNQLVIALGAEFTSKPSPALWLGTYPGTEPGTTPTTPASTTPR